MTKNIKIHYSLIISISFLFSGYSYPWESFSKSYNLLTTIAGNSPSDNNNANIWSAGYEGKSAVNAQLSGPHIAVADSAGNVYIADKDAHAIRKVNPEGIITTVAGTNVSGDGGEGRANEQALSGPNGLWVNKKGEFYILDLGNSKIRKVDLEGNMTTLIVDTTWISVGRGLWVSNTEDTVWYASGSEIRMWTKASGIVIYANGFSALGNIVQDRNGYIVATDRVGNLVYRIDKQGNKTIIAGNGLTAGGADSTPALETGFWGVRGVWFLEDNTFFLGTHEGSQVWYIDEEGIAHLFLDGRDGDGNHSGDNENYRTPGIKISEARAVTVDYQGNVLVTENDRGFVRKIEKTNTAVLTGHAAFDGNSMQVYPNPSSGSIKVKFTLLHTEKVTICIYNQSGRIVEELMAEKRAAGTHEITWQSRNLPCGVYCIILRSERISATQKCLLLR